VITRFLEPDDEALEEFLPVFDVGCCLLVGLGNADAGAWRTIEGRGLRIRLETYECRAHDHIALTGRIICIRSASV
jgi:hypothetical protein